MTTVTGAGAKKGRHDGGAGLSVKSFSTQVFRSQRLYQLIIETSATAHHKHTQTDTHRHTHTDIQWIGWSRPSPMSVSTASRLARRPGERRTAAIADLKLISNITGSTGNTHTYTHTRMHAEDNRLEDEVQETGDPQMCDALGAAFPRLLLLSEEMNGPPWIIVLVWFGVVWCGLVWSGVSSVTCVVYTNNQ